VTAPNSRSIAFFAHERGDARVVKRISALQDQGWNITGFTFHRVREKQDIAPTWNNIHLGTTYNRRYLQRLWAFVKSVGVLWKNRHPLATAQVIYVINTDNALLALLGRWFGGGKAPIVLELADIQPAMTGSRLMSKSLRSIERFVLHRIALLVTTSPGFVREYFKPVQQFEGEIFLLENKVYPSTSLPATTEPRTSPINRAKPWMIGYFGAFRCRRSLELIHALAKRLGDRVHFILRGYAAGTISDEFENLLGKLPNLRFEGPYHYPDDLSTMYQAVDFNWAFDESDAAGNSAWLLPNRIYEGGCFGVPAIASSTTETGRWIEKHGYGWSFPEPLSETLAEFFESLDPANWEAIKNHCASQPRHQFTGEKDYEALSTRLSELISRISP